MQQLKVDLLIQIPSEMVLITKVELQELKQQSLQGAYWNLKELENTKHLRKEGTTMNQLHEVAEVAKLLKCNKNTVYSLIKSGQLQGLKLGRMKVSSFELEAFMKRNIGKDLTDPFNVKNLEVIQS